MLNNFQWFIRVNLIFFFTKQVNDCTNKLYTTINSLPLWAMTGCKTIWLKILTTGGPWVSHQCLANQILMIFLFLKPKSDHQSLRPVSIHNWPILDQRKKVWSHLHFRFRNCDLKTNLYRSHQGIHYQSEPAVPWDILKISPSWRLKGVCCVMFCLDRKFGSIGFAPLKA